MPPWTGASSCRSRSGRTNVHPWHDVPPGDAEALRIVVEVPRDTTTKYELDKDLGVLNVNRILSPPVTYPANYGFVPRTLDEDGDPLDALVLMQNAVVPLSVLRARLVGVVRFRDEGDSDDKLICVHIDDPVTAAYELVEALPEYQRDELKWFFESCKGNQDGAEVEGFRGVKEAQGVLRTCLERYEKRFK